MSLNCNIARSCALAYASGPPKLQCTQMTAIEQVLCVLLPRKSCSCEEQSQSGDDLIKIIIGQTSKGRGCLTNMNDLEPVVPEGGYYAIIM